MDDILKVDDVRVVFEFLKHCNLADGRTWDPIILVVNLDLLDSNFLLRSEVLSQTDNAVGSLA